MTASKGITLVRLDQETTYEGDMMAGIFSAVNAAETRNATSVLPISLKPLSIDEVLDRAKRSAQ